MSMSTRQVIGDLERLQRAVLEKAQVAAERTLAQARAEAEKRLQEAEARAQEREEELVRAGRSEVERTRKRIISQKQLQLKGELLERKAAILMDIVEGVRARLLGLRSSERYLEILLAAVRRALTGEENPGQVILYLNREDLDAWGEALRTRLEAELKLNELELREAGIAGGVIVELPARRLQFDSSLEQVIREFRPEIERLVQEEVFASLEKGRGDGNRTRVETR